METPDSRFSELVDLVKSWIPRRPKPANVSRDFWMPDHSCRVCYECDSQFTVFNRRHHCRLCGRVFCGKCTANSVSAPSDDVRSGQDESERIRVCNYCFRQREQDVTTAYNENRGSTPGLSPSLSATSLASTKSSGTANSIDTTAGSMSYTTGTYQRMAYSSAVSPCQSVRLEPNTGGQDMLTEERNMDSIIHIGDPSSNHFGFCMNRSDDDEDDYCACRSDSETQQFHQSDGYHGPAEFDEFGHGYGPHKMHPNENNDQKDLSYPQDRKTEFQASVGVDKVADEAGLDNMSECDTSSSIYNIEGADAEPVDFENNGLLWLIPDPEDGEDEREVSLFDDDDEEDASGEWGNLHTSNSFGSGELRCRDRASEEHRKAMKHVVDGHFRALVSQLLQVENLCMDEENGKESWLDIITALSWEAATLLKPDTSKGDGMDPGGYLKIKCIASGSRSDSTVVKGIVCKKNVAHRRMMTRVETPRFLILGGALEYQRKANSLSSVDTLLQQETDHLKMAVAKIDAQHPNVLLVEKSVSRFAQDFLLAKGTSLVLNMKRPLLERIARCTGAQIVPSIDNLSPQMLGYCDLFHVEKLFEEHGSAGQGGNTMVKTLMFFEGCPKPLGCTVLLKGTNGDELKKVKHVIQYGVFAAYHLALETSFLADEGASLPEFPLKSPITVALPDKPSSMQRSISMIPGFTIPAADNRKLNSIVQRVKRIPHLDPNPRLNDSGIIEVAVLPLSPESPSQVTEKPNIFSSSASDLTSSVAKISLIENDTETHQSLPFPSSLFGEVMDNPCVVTCDSKEGGKLVFRGHSENGNLKINGPTVIKNHINSASSHEASESLERGPFMANGTISEEHFFGFSRSQILEQDDGHLHDQAPPKEEFPPSPSNHQSILVSLSTRCVWKGTVCERAHLFRIKYYGSFDKPLGRFLRDDLFDQGYRCRSCEMPSEAHVHCYTHRQGSLTISVKRLQDFPLPGEQDGKIWMWHRCLRCPRVNKIPPATRRLVMSDAAWGLSFGKFLELSFSNHAATSRVASCGHSLHRDCLRFYGFGKMMACFRYASIDVHSVYLPPPKLDFHYQHLDWIQKEEDEVADRAEHLFCEVLNALRQIEEERPNVGSFNNNVKVLESRHCIVDLEGNLQKEKAQFEESLQKVTKKEMKRGQLDIDILEINKLRRQLLIQSYVWDKRLVSAASLENHFHAGPNELNQRNKDKLNATEKLVDLNAAPKPQRSVTVPLSLDTKADETNRETVHVINHEEGNHDFTCPNPLISPEAREMVLNVNHGMPSQSCLSTGNMKIGDQLDPVVSGDTVCRALSDGQHNIMANLSDSLDAKWTGENGAAASEVSMSDSLSMFDAVVGASESEEHADDQGVADVADSFTMPPATKGEDSVEDVSKWIRMPFTSLYQSFNRNTEDSSLTFNASSEYNPVYIPSLLQLERHGGARLLLPIGINDTVIPVYDDEPTSIVSYALLSPEYHSQMTDELDKIRDSGDSSISTSFYDSGTFHPFRSFDEMSSEYFKSMGSFDESILSVSGSRSSLASDPLLYTKALHIRVSFADEGPLGKVKYTVTSYYAKSFDALRRSCCPSELDFIRSLSRCKKWGAQGGKSNVFFAKSLDDRFIIKQVTKTELESFIKFAPAYFKYLSESISTGGPTCLAKILGIYQVTSKHLKGGRESKIDVLVMENLLFGRNVMRLYDLKGSARSRYNADSSGNNKVLLDQNLIESMPTSPIFVGNKAKRLLERAVWNDTAFLASIDVMDYSLLVGVDEENHELVLGIIDFMRQYTWDKHLETWVKASGILGGPRNASPTVISPKQYKKRFRKAMSAYFLMVPDQWPPPTIVPSRSQSDLGEDNPRVLSLEP
uniref:1-phosphatidylinositol-3-phosphate 5-kinase n=1 Tax=Anthurium amnicola TaxID=1678845 RepID=A0A1D1XVV7_9ARAE